MIAAIQSRKTGWCWSRRLSKSYCAAKINVYRALFKRKQAYRTPGEVQLEQPIEYMYQLEPFVDRVTKDWVYVAGKPMITTAVMTERNIRSKGIADLTIDEGAFFESRQEKLYMPAKAMLRSCPSSSIHWISTPRRSTMFEQLFKMWEHDRNANTSHLNFHQVECPWFDKQGAEEDRLEWNKLGMGWMYLQEYEAEWTVAGGQIFKFVLHLGPHKYSEVERREIWKPELPPLEFGATPTHLGTDFHGEFGSVCAGWKWDRMEPQNIYAVHEYRYPNDAYLLDLSFFSSHYGGVRKRVERGGYNEGFERDSRQYGTEGAPADNHSKNLRLINALKYHIYIDPELTPNMADDYDSAAWDEQGIYAIKDVQHPCHFLDAGLIGTPLYGGNGIFTHQDKSPHNAKMEYERRREEVYRRASS